MYEDAHRGRMTWRLRAEPISFRPLVKDNFYAYFQFTMRFGLVIDDQHFRLLQRRQVVYAQSGILEDQSV